MIYPRFPFVPQLTAKMKVMCISFLILTSYMFIVPASSTDEEKYTTKYDSFGIEAILSNKRLIKAYLNCGLDRGPCLKEGNMLKEIIPEAVLNRCAKCSERQKAAAIRIIDYIIKNEPDDWIALNKKYDPYDIYKRPYVQEAKQLGIDITV